MKTISHSTQRLLLTLVVLSSVPASALAQTVSVPDPELNAAIRQTLQKPNGPLTQQDLLSLTNLNACCRNISSVEGLEAAQNLATLFLDKNQLTNFSLASPLTNLTYLDLSVNSLANVAIPSGLTKLNTLILQANLLTNFNLPAGLTALRKLDLGNNQLATFTLPSDQTGLIGLDLGENLLTSFILPKGLTNLMSLALFFNQLTNLSLPADLSDLTVLDLGNNQFANLALPSGLTNLFVLVVQSNQLSNLTLPPDMSALTELFVDGNPLDALVLSDALAAGNLADSVAQLRNQNVPVFSYPLGIQLIVPRSTAGGFEFVLTGPPGLYQVMSSTNLSLWTELASVTNTTGIVRFADPQAAFSRQKFYRARSL